MKLYRLVAATSAVAALSGGIVAAASGASGHAAVRGVRTATVRQEIPFGIDDRTGTLRIAQASINFGQLTKVTGRTLVLRESIDGVTHTVSVTVPADARVRRAGIDISLADLKLGERVGVIVSPYGSRVGVGH